jgi:hypothetical protein
MFVNDRTKVGKQRRCLATLDRIERMAVLVERLEARGGLGVALVGDVVGRARKSVDRDDRAAIPRGDESRSDRKVLVMTDRHAFKIPDVAMKIIRFESIAVDGDRVRVRL